MHELAIAESIMHQVLEKMASDRYRSVTVIGLRIGALTDVVPDALTFGFDAISRGTELEGTELRIEQVPIRGKCRPCGQVFPVDRYFFVCPACRSGDVDLVQGDELEISFLEVDTDEAAPNAEDEGVQRQ